MKNHIHVCMPKDLITISVHINTSQLLIDKQYVYKKEFNYLDSTL